MTLANLDTMVFVTRETSDVLNQEFGEYTAVKQDIIHSLIRNQLVLLFL